MKDGSFVQLQTSEQTFFNVLILRKSMFYSIDYRSRGYSRRHTHDRELMGSNPNVRYYKGFCICCYCCCEANKKYHKGWVSIIDSDSEQKEKSRDGFEPRLQSQESSFLLPNWLIPIIIAEASFSYLASSHILLLTYVTQRNENGSDW